MAAKSQFLLAVCLVTIVTCTCAQRQGSVDDDVTRNMPNHWGSCVCQVSCASSPGLPKRRQDGSVDFFRDWEAYKAGFGELIGEFWLGNSDLHRVTTQKDYVLRIDLEDFANERKVAEYSSVTVKLEDEGFRLDVGTYSGTAGDGMTSYHKGMAFSTKDRGPSDHCSLSYKGGWWYKDCHQSNLNGLYLNGATESYAEGVVWQPWRGHNYSLKTTEMKVRPADF